MVSLASIFCCAESNIQPGRSEFNKLLGTNRQIVPNVTNAGVNEGPKQRQ
jgi:uncharacterized protein YjfI (DUF2170 family)